VYNAFAALLDPGDEVLLIAPYWTTYPESIKLAGGVPVEVVTDEASGYLATVEQLDAACTDRTKVLLFVSPSNPTGAVYPPHAVALTAVSGDLSAAAKMRAAFDRRRRTIVGLLGDIPGIVCPEPHGAFYAYPSVKGLLGKPLRGRISTTSAELAAVILDEAEV